MALAFADIILIPRGEHGEGMAWEIDPAHHGMVNVNHRYPDDYAGPFEADEPLPCPHCQEVSREESYNRPNPAFRWTVVTYAYPAVVAYNEGGCNATAICLECMLAAFREHGIV